MKRLLVLLAAVALVGKAQGASDLFPKLSPRATLSQTIGTTKVTVDYHRPQVRGRKVWGELVPYGQVWRTGANEATTLSFSDPVKVNGHAVPAGTYAVFSIPNADHWTLILSKRWKQFGAFEYEPKQDLLRFDVKPKVVKEHTEWLTYEIDPASRSSAYVDLYWEKLRIGFLVEVDVDGLVSARLKGAMAKADEGDWKLYADAAEYLLDQDRDLPQAQRWVEQSIRIQTNPHNLQVKARLQRALGQATEAIQTLERSLKLAKQQRAPRHVTGPMEAQLATWKRQTEVSR
ncbi:MAG: DUF2911 domain-containing protein [Firmicutes bacterium]|nr:DUF2911 domain-containing protein [Bacillota bacterium]